MSILEGIPNWNWNVESPNHLHALELKSFYIKNLRYPTPYNSDKYEKSLYSFINKIRMGKRGSRSMKISQDIINIVESIPNWKW